LHRVAEQVGRDFAEGVFVGQSAAAEQEHQQAKRPALAAEGDWDGRFSGHGAG
jgi:hypothetical protein